jgi:epoxyqueuosine reductase
MTGLSQQIKELALCAGFDLVGIAPADQPAKSRFLDEWLARRYHGNMDWMQIRQAVRKNIQLLFPGVKSVICVGHNYYSSDCGNCSQMLAGISCYARGKDYHAVIKRKLKVLFAEIKKLHPAVKRRLCVDSAPLLEKIWAEAAGLGWQGKNTNLISRDLGSWFFLAEILVDIELEIDSPAGNYCGKCKACLKACPTGALIQPCLLDASRCISYLTIEYRAERFPESLANKMDNWIFGCDICQQVCPWNKFSKISTEPEYQPVNLAKYSTLAELLTIPESEFNLIFRHSPLRRTGYKNFKRNVQNALENSGVSK